MLSRLRREGVLKILGHGKARSHMVVFPDQSPKDLGQKETPKVVPKILGNVLNEQPDALLTMYKQARKQAMDRLSSGFLSGNQRSFESLRRQVSENQSLPKEIRDKFLLAVDDDITRYTLIGRLRGEISRLGSGRATAVIMMVMNTSSSSLAKLSTQPSEDLHLTNVVKLLASETPENSECKPECAASLPPMSDQDWEDFSAHADALNAGPLTPEKVGASLKAISERQLFRGIHPTFEEFCREELNLSIESVSNLIQSHEHSHSQIERACGHKNILPTNPPNDAHPQKVGDAQNISENQN